MKVATIVVISSALILVAIWFADDFIAPLFFNSRIERLGETGLPKIQVEKGNVVYCRMKADDFRFPLPSGSHAANPVVTGVFDSVDGSVEARFGGANQMTADAYENWLSGKVQVGGQVTAQAIPGGLLINFHYFGDR